MKKTRYRKIILRLGQAMTVCTMFFSIAGLFDTYGRHIDLLSHLRFQYFLLSLSGLVVLLSIKSWRWVALALGCVILNTMLIAPIYLRNNSKMEEQQGFPLRLLYSNVNVVNHNFSALMNAVQTEQPDIVIILETDSQWFKALSTLKANYQHQHAVSRSDGHGAAIFSRYPFNEVDVIYTYTGKLKLPTLLVTMTIAYTKFTLLATHPLPPVSDFGFSSRNLQLEELVSLINQQPSSKLVCGDFNTTMWSSYYRKFLNATGLINARQGFGILPGWPTPSYYAIFTRKFGMEHLRKRYEAEFNAFFSLPVFRIPIDHCFVSPDIRVTTIRTAKDISSDHLPLIVDFSVPLHNRYECYVWPTS